MHFEYEITPDVYTASQLLYHKLSSGRKRSEGAIGWILAGLALIVIAWNERVISWPTVLLALVGAWWIYVAMVSLFPGRHFRRAYAQLNLAGKRFNAEINEDGLDVSGDLRSWRVRWPGVQLKGENEKVFVLYSEGTIFMFGKQYLNSEQQQELRRMSGLQELKKG